MSGTGRAGFCWRERCGWTPGRAMVPSPPSGGLSKGVLGRERGRRGPLAGAVGGDRQPGVCAGDRLHRAHLLFLPAGDGGAFGLCRARDPDVFAALHRPNPSGARRQRNRRPGICGRRGAPVADGPPGEPGLLPQKPKKNEPNPPSPLNWEAAFAPLFSLFPPPAGGSKRLSLAGQEGLHRFAAPHRPKGAGSNRQRQRDRRPGIRGGKRSSRGGRPTGRAGIPSPKAEEK